MSKNSIPLIISIVALIISLITFSPRFKEIQSLQSKSIPTTTAPLTLVGIPNQTTDNLDIYTSNFGQLLYGITAQGFLEGAQPFKSGGRLSLSSGVPVMASSVTAASTVFYVPYTSANIPVFNGSTWTQFSFTQLTLTLNSSLQISGNVYDAYAFSNSGTLTICAGPAWSSVSSRGAAASITTLNGQFVNTNQLSACSNSAATFVVPSNQGTYLGTIYATANGQTSMGPGNSAPSADANQNSAPNITQLCVPQIQTITSGSGTYTTPTCNGITAQYIEVQLVGGGGGGAGGDTGTAGNNATATTFGSSLLTANGGRGGSGAQAGVGGSATGGSINIGGNSGQPGGSSVTGTIAGAGGTGGAGPFGGSGQGVYSGTAGSATGGGAGGGGGGVNAGATTIAGGGGGAGGYVFAIITSPAASYAYVVGVFGSSGSGAGTGFNGGSGANGIIIVVAHWQ